MTEDGLEKRSETVGDAGRADFHRRSEAAREPRDAPNSVREAVARHRERARQNDGRLPAPEEGGAADMSAEAEADRQTLEQPSRFGRRPEPRRDTDAPARGRHSTAYSRRFEEPQGSQRPDSLAEVLPEALQSATPAETPEPVPAEAQETAGAPAPAHEAALSRGRPAHPSGTRPGRLRFGADKTAPQRSRPPSRGIAPAPESVSAPAGKKAAPIAESPVAGATVAAGAARPPGDPKAKPQRPSKLQFAAEEAPPIADAPPPDKKPARARTAAERSSEKSAKAQNKLPTKRRIRSRRVFDDAKGKPKRELYFEKEAKSMREHLKGPAAARPVRAAGNAAVAYGHMKVCRAEHENVAVKAAHRGETLAEGGLRTLYRHRKAAPYRKAERLTRKSTKLNIKADFRQAPHDNPKLKSNPLSRMAQRRRIRKQYAKAIREAKKNAGLVKKSGDFVGRAAGAAVRLVARHPLLFATIGGFALLFFLISALVVSCSNLGAGMGSAVMGATYLAEDADVDGAELLYTEWETDLRMQIASAERDRPGFDEYRYDVGDISHDPCELLACLTARLRDFTLAGADAELRSLFAEQYALAFAESAETRYRTVARTDPETGETYDEQEPYDWRVLTVTLTARSFADVAEGRMDAEQLQHYSVLMRTRGNRRYAGNPLGFVWLRHVSSYYGWRVHPTTGAKDYHKGVDIAVPIGTDILAAHDGTIGAGYDADGYGNYVTLTGADGLVTKYAHLDSVLAADGQTVKAGDVIAKSGNTGRSTGPHLHFEALRNGVYLNPIIFSDVGG
jgi:murein DD-endopeptidase MepM/ murein hydrolase activator NlpD